MPDVYREPIEEGREEAETFRPEPLKKEIKKLPIENEILELEKKIVEKRKELEKVKKLEGVVEKIGEKPTTPTAISREEELTEEEKLSLKKIKNLTKEKQLETLEDIALWKGLSPAIKIARALNNAYILDEFHDNLIDKLYKELLSRGKLKE